MVLQQDSLNLLKVRHMFLIGLDASGHPLRFSTNADGTHSGGV